MALLNNFIKVKELTDNLEIDGILEKYDSTSPYMFCKIVDLDKEALNKLEHTADIHGNMLSMSNIFNNSVIVAKRVTKVRGLDGYYIQLQDVIEIMSKETYNKYVVKE